jgi:uncharacterized membrane protein
MGRTLLFLGVGFSWIAVWTGNLAEDIVNRVICDPTITHTHETLSLWASALFSVAAALEIAALWKKFYRRRRWLSAAAIVLMVTATLFLGRAAHLGKSLIHQQGAAVYHPSPECREFE